MSDFASVSATLQCAQVLSCAGAEEEDEAEVEGVVGSGDEVAVKSEGA